MANTREIKRRIRSAKNIGQITRAQQMVSASKMKKAHAELLSSQAYHDEVLNIFSSLIHETDPLLLKKYFVNNKKDKQALVFIVGPTRGLAGALISNLVRYTLDYINKIKFAASENQQNLNIKLVTIEKRSKDFAARMNFEKVAHFDKLAQPLYNSIAPITSLILEEFDNQKADEVHVIYTKYISAFIQKANSLQLFPIDKSLVKENEKQLTPGSYLLEPTAEILIEKFIPLYIQSQIYNCILESITAEHSARMVAMQSATDNAKSLAQQLVLEYNQTRQASVTQEVLEIVSAQL